MTKGEARTQDSTAEDIDRHRELLRRFSIRSSDGVTTLFESRGARMVIGSQDSADLVIDDATVSRFHCQIELVGGRAVIRDLTSRNGTRVDGTEVSIAYLHDGARISVGKSELVFSFRAGHVEEPLSRREAFGDLVGGSIAMRRVFSLLERAAQSDATVLLLGETGTGKEAAAEAIHRESERRAGPFLVVDCSAIPLDLLESELFGDERGTGDREQSPRLGVLEDANGGTVFLEEIGELPATLQPRLLRLLERKELKRAGANVHVPIDVRIVAATSRDLRADVNEKKFRADLLYRLAVLEIQMPPLRERQEDLPLLIERFLAAIPGADRADCDALLDGSSLRELERHSWPGNVRELRNYLERCISLRERVAFSSLPSDAVETASSAVLEAPLKIARERWSRAFEKRYVSHTLEKNDGNVAAAAREAGVDRMYFYRLLWRHGLR